MDPKKKKVTTKKTTPKANPVVAPGKPKPTKGASAKSQPKKVAKKKVAKKPAAKKKAPRPENQIVLYGAGAGGGSSGLYVGGVGGGNSGTPGVTFTNVTSTTSSPNTINTNFARNDLTWTTPDIYWEFEDVTYPVVVVVKRDGRIVNTRVVGGILFAWRLRRAIRWAERAVRREQALVGIV